MTILAGDLGGTKTLLSVYNDDRTLRKIHQRKYLSSKWESLEEILIDFLDNLPQEIKRPSHGCIAVAGPVLEGKSKITNLPWNLNSKQICTHIGLEKYEIINDFCAVVYALPLLRKDQYVEIQNSFNKIKIDGRVAVLGAGTGLGVARGINTKEGIIALPSESGHQEFSPNTEPEWELKNWLKKELMTPRISVERIVSGTGLGYIAHWLLQKQNSLHHPLYNIANDWSQKNKSSKDLPALVSKAAENNDPLMIKALHIWLNAYGSAAGDIALQELCYSGLWIGGGTAAKHIKGLRSKSFLEAMKNKGRFQCFIQELPVMALIDPEAGLLGAASRAHKLSVSTEQII